MISAFTLPCWLQEAARRWPDRCWIRSGEREVTFEAAWKQVQALAGGLQELGLTPGGRLIILTENRLEGVLLFFAAMLAGGTAVVLHPQTKPEGLRRIIDQTEPVAAVLDQSTASLAAEFGKLPILMAEQSLPLSELRPVDALPEAPAFLVFTSGSTGTPRGVMLMHEGVRFVSEAIQARLDYREDDHVGVFLPLSFDVGLYQLFFSLMRGCTLFLGRPEQAGPELGRILATEGITVLPAVPTLLAGLIKMQRFRPVSLPRLRAITSTGDHLAQSHISQLRDLFPQASVFPMYGLTECKRVSILLPDELENKPGSVGRALDGTEVFAMDEIGNRMPPGTKGELGITGPHLAAGYWRAPEETAKRYRIIQGKRVLFSGDFGHVDDEGFIFLSGRADFVIKHRGFRMSPAEIEEAACTLAGVTDAGCVKDDQRDLLCLFISSPATLEPQAIRQELSRILEPAKVPDVVRILTDLPRTANQKVDRKALRAFLA
ncbi:MAG: AMP-binding protein [Verrucomicrobiaceae bacterium]|nr:AMP-binding protein [Verrucomicrobiaceae bacterium]